MDVIISKKLLRSAVLDARKLLSEEEYQNRNSLLINRLQLYLQELKSNSIHSFLPISKNREPDVRPLFKGWWDNNVTILVSNTDFKTRVMTHSELLEDTPLIENRLGIPEPVEPIPVPIFDPDIILVPLVAADKSLHRIGYGGGFYDQLLTDTKSKKIGISLSPSLDEIYQTEEWDIVLDVLITPFQIISL